MKLTFTDTAVEALKKRDMTQSLSLFYYTDSDCGCPSSGIFALRSHDDSDAIYDATVETNLGEMIAQKWALVYLDAENVIDYKAGKGTFILKSERGYLNMNMPVEDKRKVH